MGVARGIARGGKMVAASLAFKIFLVCRLQTSKIIHKRWYAGFSHPHGTPPLEFKI